MSTRSLKRRLIAGFGANTFSRLSTTLTQIFSVPVFLSHWGVHLYGEWILLNTIPSYLGLSDVGFGSVAGNEMTMLAAAQDFDQALVVFQSVWVLTTVITSLLGLLLIATVWLLPLGAWLNMHAISGPDARLIVLLLGLAVLLGMQETLFQAAFRCVGKYPLGTMAKSLVVLAAFLSTMIGVGLHLTPVPVTVLYVVVNAVGVVALWFLLRREVPWIRFGIRHAQWAVIRRLTGPALSYMSFPLVNALNFQGILVVIGYVLGPIAVVTFNTARTISRSAAQGMNLINNSIWPEMSAAFGVGAMDIARMLHRRACQISLFLCLGITLGVAFSGRLDLENLDRRQGADRPRAIEPHVVADGGLGLLVHQLGGALGDQPAPEDGASRAGLHLSGAGARLAIDARELPGPARCGHRAAGRRPLYSGLCTAREPELAWR